MIHRRLMVGILHIYILIIHMMACIKETDHCDDSWFKELLIRPQNDDE